MALANPKAQHQIPTAANVPTMWLWCRQHRLGTCPLLHPLTPFLPRDSPFPLLQRCIPKSFGFFAFLMPELFLTTKLPALQHFPPAANDTGYTSKRAGLRYLPRRKPASTGTQQSRMAQKPVRAISTLPHIIFKAPRAMARRSDVPCRAVPCHTAPGSLRASYPAAAACSLTSMAGAGVEM